jgi:hypothetical protein
MNYNFYVMNQTENDYITGRIGDTLELAGQ